MDPNTLPKPQFELPKPQNGEGLAPSEADSENVKATEKRNMEQQGTPGPAQPLNAGQAAQSVDDANPAGAATIIPVLPGAPGTAASVHDPLPAEDGDLIEKAWVQKAKDIVERTKNDPYNQNREINKVKKEYIQKRYQKDVKLSDEWG